MMGYVSLCLGVACAASLAYGQWGWQRVDILESRVVQQQLWLASCNSQLQTLRADKESDDAIDTIPDGDLSTVPDHWLHAPAAATGE